MMTASNFHCPTVHQGEVRKALENVLGDGLQPLSAADLMRNRLEHAIPNTAGFAFWWQDHFDLGDALAYLPDGSAKIVYDPGVWPKIASARPLVSGALPLHLHEYDALRGVELDARVVERYASGTDFSKQQVLDNPIWQALAGDRALLHAYVDATFALGKQQHGYEAMMAIFVSRSIFNDANRPALRLWHSSALHECRCSISGEDGLYYCTGRLVGVE